MSNLPAGKAGNKIATYLLYAIGEIVLVVTGILIAVQLDNANNEAKERAKERVLIEEIHEEFLINRAQFDSLKIDFEKAYLGIQWIIDVTPIKDVDALNYDSLHIHFENAISYTWTFKPSQSTVKSLVNTSSFEYISDKKLRKLLIQWPDILLDFQIAEEELQEYRKDNMIPYMIENLELKRFYTEGQFETEFMETKLFANQMWTMFYRFSQIYEDASYLKVDESIDQIIELTKPAK